MKETLKVYKKTLKRILSKRIAPIVLATFVGTGAIQCVKACVKGEDSKITNSNSLTLENEIGYDDIDLYLNRNVYSNDFVILHVENKMFQDISELKAKIKKCNDAGISIGLVLDTKSDNLADIYKDFDFLQAIVKDYTIDLPIYCNIENIVNNNTLNNAEKSTLVQAFIDKAKHSNLYLGLYGSDTTLYNFDKYIFNIQDYNCFLVEDSEERKYTGKATITQNLNGEIRATDNLAKIIAKNDLNNPSKLVYSSLYTVKEGDTYELLSLQYGLSVQDLKNYNTNLGKTLKPGDVIKIPNYYLTYDYNRNEVQYNYAIGRGIDISNYQTNINWDRIAETSDFVIVQVARNGAGYIPESIEQIKGTIDKNIDLGLYFCINKDMNMEVFKDKMDEYLTKFKNDLAANNINLDFSKIPVFLDFEIYYEYNDYYGLMKIFEEKVSQLGCQIIGIYANKSTLENINTNMENTHNVSLKDTNWKIWLAGGPQYEVEGDHLGYKLNELKELSNEVNNSCGFVPDIRQVTNVATDTGASNTSGYCDVNYLYTKDIFGNELPPQEDLIDVMEIDLSNYINISGYEFNKIMSLVNEYMFNISATAVTVTILAISAYSVTVGIYRKQKNKKLYR